MNTLVVLIASSLCGQTYTVTNRMPQFTVVNKCCDPFAVVNKAPFAPKTKLTAFKTQTIVTHQASSDHTHSCPNAQCPFRKAFGEPYTFNHRMNKSHNCPYCNTQQLEVSNRPVTVLRTIQVSVVTQPVLQRPATPVSVTPSSLQRSATIYQNCGTSG